MTLSAAFGYSLAFSVIATGVWGVLRFMFHEPIATPDEMAAVHGDVPNVEGR